MGSQGEAELRAARTYFGLVTRALARVDPGLIKEPTLPLILEALDPYMDNKIKEKLKGVQEEEEDVRDILVNDVIIPLIEGLLGTALEVSTSAPKPAGNSSPGGMISVADFSLLSASLELLVLWGIYPHLEAGVGLRLDRRAEFKGARFPAKLVVWGVKAGMQDEKDEEVQKGEEEEEPKQDSRMKRSRSPAGGGPQGVPDPRELLLSCGRVLEMSMSLAQYSLFFKARHGADLVAAYLQVALGTSSTSIPPGEGDASSQRVAMVRLEAFLDSIGLSATLTILRDLLSRGREAPAWLRQECSGRMTSTLMKSGGVRAVLEAFLGNVSAQEEDTHAHMRVAELLASLPSGMTPTEYLSAIGPQLPPLFHVQGPHRPVVLRLAALIVSRLCEKMGPETRRMVLRPLLDALVRSSPPLALLDQPPEVEVGSVVVSREEEVSLAIVDLEALLFSSTPRPALLEALANPGLIRALLGLYAFALGAKSELVCRVEACVLELVGSSRRGHMLLLDAYLQLGRGETVFAPGGTGGAELRRRDKMNQDRGRLSFLQSLANDASTSSSTTSMEAMLERLGRDAEVAVKVLNKVGADSQVPGQLFERLLLSFLLLKVRREETRALVLEACDAGGNADLRKKPVAEKDKSHGVGAGGNEEDEAAALLVLLEKAAGSMGERVFGSGRQIIQCCRLVLLLVQANQRQPPSASEEGDDALLHLASSPHQPPQEDEQEEEEEEEELGELASVVLGLLGVLLEMGEERRQDDEEHELRQLLPLLDCMARDTSHRPALAEMAQILQAMILTRGLSLGERKEQRERERRAAKAAAQEDDEAGGGGPVVALGRLLDEVQVDLKSVSPPVRARGICSLIKLIHGTPSSCLVEEGNPLVQRLLSQLVVMLQDKESYVYLAAVQGLAVLSERAPAQVIPHLVKCLRGAAGGGGGRQSTMMERLKAGEALVLAARRCGEAMPKYAAQMVPAFIMGARPIAATTQQPDQEASSSSSSWEKANFRASCLSNLAEVCGLLGWSLQRYLEDVCDLALGILKHEHQSDGAEDEARRVRRGAVFLLGKMIAGTDSRLLAILPRHLPELSRVLQQTADHDKDPVTRFHAACSLAVIESLVEDQLQPLDLTTYVSPMEQLTRRLEAWGTRNRLGLDTISTTTLIQERTEE